jgi:hypothetical protein
MLMGVTSWELGVLRVPLIMVPDTFILLHEDIYTMADLKTCSSSSMDRVAYVLPLVAVPTVCPINMGLTQLIYSMIVNINDTFK